jgi:cytochrome d ubiquinol oxidase subunit I
MARGRLGRSRLFLKLLILAVPLPYLANETGWIAAEVGRQPWAVFRVLRTSDAASAVVPAGNIVFSLASFVLIYALIAGTGIAILLRTVRRGPGEPDGAAGPRGER